MVSVIKSLLVYFTALSPKATQVSLIVVLASGHVPIADLKGWPEVSNNMLLYKKIIKCFQEVCSKLNGSKRVW